MKLGKVAPLIAVAAMLSAVAMAGTTFTNYGDFVAADVDFLQVTEQTTNPGDTVPKYGMPNVNLAGNSMDFNPVGFSAIAENGSSDITDGNLVFTAAARDQMVIEQIGFSERGNFSLGGAGTTATYVDVDAFFYVEVTEVNFQPIESFGIPVWMDFNPNTDGTFELGVDGGSGIWSGRKLRGRTMKRIIITACMVAVACTVQANLAPGTTIEDYLPVITASTVEAGGVVYTYEGALEEFEVEETKFKLKGELSTDTGSGIITLQELEFDPDPYVFVSQLVYNNTLIPQTYQILIDQPAYLATASSQVYGAVVISLLDEANDGAYLIDNGTPLYKALIDGNEVDTLLDDPYVLTAPTTVNSGLQQFGWDNYGAGVVSNIAIQVEFTLSPGDSATVQGSFEVIPEPASMVLIGLTASAFTFIRRRFIG